MSRFRSAPVFLASFFPCIGVAETGTPPTDVGVGHASPLRTTSALPLELGEWSIFANVQYLEFDAFSDADLLRSTGVPGGVDSTDAEYEASLVVSFGATDNLTLSLSLPYVWNVNIRELQQTEGGAGGQNTRIASLGDSDGLGDLTLLGQYRLYHNPQHLMNVAVLGGIKTPTGVTDVRTRQGQLFSTDHQPGSGSWDGLFGVAATKFSGRVALDVSLLYDLTTEGAQNTRLGDGLFLDFATSYRLAEGFRSSSRRQTAKDRAWWDWFSWDAVFEIEVGWSAKDTVDGEADPNSGGLVVALSPGFRASPGRGWDATLSFDFPIHTNLNGTQVSPRWGMLASIGRSF